MSCKYVLNGKEYTKKEILNLTNSSSGLMSVRTRTVDETIELLKKEVGDRFVNIDLFTPYQENIFVNSITTDILDQIGVLSPSAKIKVAPNDAFLKTLAKFEGSKKVYAYLFERLDTDEKVQIAKSNPDYTAKFKQLNYVSTVADIKERLDIFTNVVDNFEKFKQKAKIRLKKYGLNIKEGDNKFEELKLDEAYFKSLVEGDVSSENVTEDERTIMETFEDGSSFMMNPRDTASTRVKLFFARIPSDKMNSLGIREYVPYDDIIENFLEIGSDLEKVTFENFIEELENRSRYRPYLLEVKKRLINLKATNNTQLLQEVLTFANKAYQEQTLVKWSETGSGVKVDIIKSNRNSTILQVYNDWLEQQKNSDIVTTKNGQLVIDSEKAKELKESLEKVRVTKTNGSNSNNTIEKKKEWVKNFLATIGIDFTDEMINELESQAEAKKFAKNSLNLNFAQMFNPNGFFHILVEQYNKPTTGKAETLYEDANNAMKDQSSIFKLLAEIYYNFTPNRYHTGSSRNGENKSIYAFINPTYLEQVKKKIKYGTGFIDKILNRAFAKNSNFLKAYKKSKEENANNVVLEFTYADSIKKTGKDKGAVVRKNQSEREQLFEAIQKHQNEGGNSGYYNMFTLSDKTTVPIVQLSKYKFNDAKQGRIEGDISFYTAPDNPESLDDYYDIEDSLKNELYNLAESEINRIVTYSKKYRANSDYKIQANFDKAYQFFYLFPVLNTDDVKMKEIRNKMFNGEMPSEEDKVYIKELLTNTFKKQVKNTYRKFLKLKLIETTKNPDGTIYIDLSKSMSAKYLEQDNIKGLRNNIQKLIFSIAEFKFNYIRSQVISMQLLGADPALFYKENKKVKGKNYTQLLFEDKLSLVKSTMDEFSKRAAMFIAPGSQGVWNWYDMNGELVDRNFYNSVTIEDIVLDTDLFKGIESTDAQEYITLQEHIDRLMSEGRIPPDIWQSINDKIVASKDGMIKLSPREMDVVLQPTKPVHTNDVDVDSSFNRIDYVKSSTYPLIPEVIADSPLAELAKYFHEKNIRSGNFKTAKKTGQPGNIIKLFDKEGNFVRPSDKDLENSKQVLSREGLRTQQEIPGQKEEIRNMSQANRVLFEGLLDVDDFYISNKQMTGRELKTLKENVRINLFENAKQDLLTRFGIKEDSNGSLIFKNKKALEILLKEEAIERNFSINDIESIRLNKKGEFIIPLYLMQRGEKFEGLLNSLINKVVQLKNPGTSLVQVTGVNHKYEFDDLTGKTKNEIIWLPGYDSKKGLQYLRKSQDKINPDGSITKGKIEAAQVIVSQFIRDDEGNLIDLSKFIKIDPKTNRKMLDTSKFSKEMFQLVASRIPNQGLSSMLPIEVVGFLPSYMENTVVVPNGITKQMGSDFDVDKLYAYISTMKFRYSTEAKKSLQEIEKQIITIKSELENTNTELFKNFLTSSDQTEIKKLKESKNKIVSKLKWNLSEKEKARKQKSIDNIDKVIEAIYENLKLTNSDQYLKLRQTQLLNKKNAEKKIQELKEKKAEIKSANITGAEPVSYNLQDYKGKYTDLSNFSDDQLHQLYRDISWEVLTHPAAFEKIARSIDFDDIKNEAELLESIGLYDSDDSYIPMDVEEQIKIFNDNRSGKKGVGIFASLGSFLADNQDKELILARYDPQLKTLVPDFIEVLDSDNQVMELTKITEAGETIVKEKDGTESVRTKIDNNSMCLSESLDNAKNKNLYRFNWSEDAMSAITSLVALSDKNNRILSIKFATRFFKQPIIEEWVSKTQVSKDSLSTYVADVKTVIIDELKDKYFAMMTPDEVLEFKDPLNKRKPTLFGENNLLDLLKESKNIESLKKLVDDESIDPVEKNKIQARLSDFAKKQIDILNLFTRLNDIGGNLTGVIGASYIYTKGIGSNIFELMSNINKLGNLNQESNLNFLGLSAIAGEVEFDDRTGRSYILNPKGEIGHSIVRSLDLAEKLYKQLFPIHFGDVYYDISSLVFNGKKINKRDVGKERFVEINSKLFKAIRSYLFSSPTLDICDDVTEERRRLLQETKDNPSLAQRIVNAKATYPELADNYFFRRLSTNVSTVERGTSQVIYNNPFGDIDELENNKGFLALIFSGNDELIQIAKDLAIYSFITGANQTSTSFGKFIPIEYFIADEDFIKGINSLPDMLLKNQSNFYKQYIQNNPEMATSLPSKIHSRFKDLNGFTIDSKNPFHESIIVDMTAKENGGQNGGKKFADFVSFTDYNTGIVFLYQRISYPDNERAEYKRINTLGTTKNGFTEYSMGNNNLVSLISSNLTFAQKNAIKEKLANQDQQQDDENLSDFFFGGVVPEPPDITDLENGYSPEAPEGYSPMDSNTVFGGGNISEKINIYYGTGENAELSNFATRPFTIGGLNYQNVESAYQHTKLQFSDFITEQPLEIQQANWFDLTGPEAKALGPKFKGLDDKEWDRQSSQIMKTLIKASFEQNPDALQKLLATGNAELTHKGRNKPDKWTREFPRLLMEVRDELRNTQEETDTTEITNQEETISPAEYINHSGGAEGADSVWDQVGRTFGVNNHIHYYTGVRSEKNAPLGNVDITNDPISQQGANKVALAAQKMWGYKYNSMKDQRLIRNWAQVANSESVFAIAPIGKKGDVWSEDVTKPPSEQRVLIKSEAVQGGTGYAVEMAIQAGKKVYVYNDTNAKAKSHLPQGWYTWDGSKFVSIPTPTLTKNYAGIGSRGITEKGIQAIIDVYENTFSVRTDNQLSNINQQGEGVSIEYTPVGKTRQTYTVIGDKIFNKNNEEVFSAASRDRNKIFANVAVKLGKAVVVDYRNNKYVVNDRNDIMSVRTGDIMKWGAENGDRKAIINLANIKRNKVKTTVEDFTSYSELKNLPVYSDKGVNVLRKNNTNEHFGNPFVGSVRPNANYDKLVKVNNDAEALSYYYNWLLGNHYTDLYPKQREWILKQIISGKLDGQKLLYYKPYRLENLDGTVIEGGYYSHADYLADLINSKDQKLYAAATELINKQGDITSLQKDLEIDTRTLEEPTNPSDKNDNDVEIDFSTLDAPEPDERLNAIFGLAGVSNEYSFESDKLLRELFPANGKNSLKDVLNNLHKTTKNDFYKNLLSLIFANKEIDFNTIIELTDNLDHPGVYINGVIKINPKLARKDNPKRSEKENIETVIMHELMHKLTQDLLKRYKKDKVTLNRNQLIFIKNIENMFNDVRDKVLSDPKEGPILAEIIKKMNDPNVSLTSYEKSMYYGLTNIDEFVSMMMTDRTFQMNMNNTLYDVSKNQSVFERFKELLANLFSALAKTLGIEINNSSILKNTVDNVVRVITEPNMQDHTDDNDTSGDANEPSLKPPVEPISDKDANDYILVTPNGKFKANDQQIVAIDRVVEHLSKPVTSQDLYTNSFLLYGPGGTGKTACINTATSRIKNKGLIGYCAPSHTAKKELKRAGNENAKTFASYLGIKPKRNKYGNQEFTLIDIDEYRDKRTGELDQSLLPSIFKDDIVIIDESSMIGAKEIEYLNKRIEERATYLSKKSPLIVFMGDYAQIPPIGEANDKDGWAIELMKNSEKSVGLVKVERTKNQDITDLGFVYRRGIDYYNENLKRNINSYNTNLSPSNFLNQEHTKTSSNVLFSNNQKQILDKYVEILKKDPLNPKNAVYIHYNNENHKNTIEKSFAIRKEYLGDKYIAGQFIVESDLVISKIPEYKTDDVITKEPVEIAANERLIIKSFQEGLKTFNFGRVVGSIKVPGKKVVASTGENTVSFFLPDYKFMLQFNNDNVVETFENNRIVKGFAIKDYEGNNEFIPFRLYYALKDHKEYMEVEHGYILTSHKVQGQTYNNVFVDELNIRKHVFQGSSGEYILTPKSYAQSMYVAVSRAREKLFVMTDRIGQPREPFIEPDFKNIMKSVRTEEFSKSELPNEFYLENQCKS